MGLSGTAEVRNALAVAAHPLRLDLLEGFVAGAISGAADAAAIMQQPLGHVEHQIRLLHKKGWLVPAEPPAETRAVTATYAAHPRAHALVRALRELTRTR